MSVKKSDLDGCRGIMIGLAVSLVFWILILSVIL